MAIIKKLISNLLEKSPSLQLLAKAATEEKSLLIEELWEGPKALLIALLASHLNKHILVISGGSEDRLYTDLSFFKTKDLFDFPSWETLPGEEISPSPDLVGKRLEVLHSILHQKTPHIILSPLQAVLQKLPHPQDFKPLVHEWKKGDVLEFTHLESLLINLGYKKSRVVSDKGEFAIRGGILDLFPLSSTDPYRAEFFGNQIDEIRTFDPISQNRSKK